MSAFSLVEKIATVATSRRSGAFGTFTDMGMGRCRVIVDGVTALISGNEVGWLVRIVGKMHIVSNDADLEIAIKNALEV